MDSAATIMEPELVATCNALGAVGKTSKTFELGEDCAHGLRDLLRSLRRDSDANRFKYIRQLGQLNVVISKLIPILKDHCLEDVDMFDVVLRLLVMVTSPTMLLFKDKTPENKENNQLYLELTMQHYEYKLAFGANLKCWSVLAKHAGRILALSTEDRDIVNTRILERILILVRNLLHVPLAPSLEMNTKDELNPQDRLIDVMQNSGLSELILFMCDSADEHESYCLHLLEIVSLMLREQNAEFLAKTYKVESAGPGNRRTTAEKDLDREDFGKAAARDKSSAPGTKQYYSRFKEATYMFKNLKSLSDNDVILHKTPLNPDVASFNISDNKQKKLRRRNNRALTDDVFASSEIGGASFHRSTPTIRRHLGRFCEDFLTSYNALMKTVRHKLSRKLCQENDESYFLWAAQFFMEFNRFAKPDLELVIETFSLEYFHYVHTLVQTYLDHLKLEKKVYIAWSRRLHLAVRAYRELLFNIYFANSSLKYQDHDLAKSITARVFYEDDYRELLLVLFKEFNEVKMTKGMLKEMVETNHVFLAMLKKYCIRHQQVVVKQKKRKVTKKKTKQPEERNESIHKELWDDMESELTEVLSGDVPLPTAEENEDVLPMDSTVDYEPDLQKMSLMKRLHKMLLDKRLPEAVALYRNAREAWSDDGEMTFGAPDIDKADELLGLQEIYNAQFSFDEDGESQEKDEEEVEEAAPARKETALLFDDYVKKYCSRKVVNAYCLLLNNYESNTSETNKCVVKMLHRIAVDCSMHGMLFQASLFRTFQKLFKEHAESHPELTKFAKYIVAKFVAMIPKNDKALIELLFWKNCREAVMVEDGYND